MIAQTTQGTLRFIGQVNLICHKAILICSKNFKKAILVSEGYLGSSTASPPADQVIEQTVNRDQKGPGGIIGFSTTEGTVQRMDIDEPHCSPTDFTDGRFIATNQVRKCSERFNTKTSKLC